MFMVRDAAKFIGPRFARTRWQFLTMRTLPYFP